MKAEHRHELQTNQLAEWLEDSIQTLKPYTRAIVGVAVAILILVGLYSYYRAKEHGEQAEAIDLYVQALQNVSFSGPQELQEIATRYRGTQPAVLAQLVAAEAQLSDGTNALYSNKPAARETLSHAAGDFGMAEQATSDPMLRAWALYGLGRAYESLGNLDRARSEYRDLIKDYPDSALLESARNHLAQLDRSSIKEFYDWFAKQDPRPPAMDKSTGIPGLKPSFDLTEPASSAGDFKLPGAGDSKEATDSKPSGEAPSGDVSLPPAGGAATGAKSTTNSPPATESKPADAKAPPAAAKTAPAAKAMPDSKTPADAKPKK